MYLQMRCWYVLKKIFGSMAAMYRLKISFSGLLLFWTFWKPVNVTEFLLRSGKSQEKGLKLGKGQGIV